MKFNMELVTISLSCSLALKDNVQALMDSTSKAQIVLPAVFKAIEDITKLSDIYEKYTTDLRVRN